MKKENNTIANATTQKKITFFAAILIVMGSTIGAGIFFKSATVLNNSQGSLVLAIFCWLIAAVSVICMALALIEITSARNDNLSFLSWTKVFCSRNIFKASKNFMFYIYMPSVYICLPMYVFMSLQDGIGALIDIKADGYNTDPVTFNTNFDWLIWLIISLILGTYFILVSGYWSKIGDIQNKIITYLKFIPLAAVTIIGLVLVAKLGSEASATVSGANSELSVYNGDDISNFMPGLGLFLAMGAIYFAYDGFYVSAGIQSEMKDPKKTPMVLFIGLATTTIIYLIIAVAMSVNGNGSFVQMQTNMQSVFTPVIGNALFGIINILIGIGILGIINGFSIWAPRFNEDLIKVGELPLSDKYINKLNANKPKVGIVYSIVTAYPVVIIFGLIGALGYLDTEGYSSYGSGMGGLYSFSDLIAAWTSLLAFVFIVFAIIGGIKNRKTQKVKTDQKKYFLPCAYIASVITLIALFVTVLLPVINMFLLSQVNPNLTNFKQLVIGRVLLVVVLIICWGLMYLPTWIEDYVHKKKFGNLTKYEEYRTKIFKD